MVNHVRTLLLNETQASLRSAGRPYGDPWVVSPSFSAVAVPGRLVPFQDAVFVGASSLQDRISRVDAVMSVISAPDLSEFLGLFDTRSTVSTEPISTVSGLYAALPGSSEGFEDAISRGSWAQCGLYAPIGDRRMDGALARLFSIHSSSFECVPRVAAPILAYCVQLEGARRGTNA